LEENNLSVDIFVKLIDNKMKRGFKSCVNVLGIRRLVAILFFSLVGLFSFFILVKLPYSTSVMERVSKEELSKKPSPNFKIGSVEWDMDVYQNEPKLDIFRDYFKKYCFEQKGVEAALCVSRKLSEQIPSGIPFDEFLNPYADMISSFSRYISGSPGHCVTRSGYLSAILLSNGIPARVVQIAQFAGAGHNFTEVWDEAYGWVLVDPYYDCIIGTESGYFCATSALGAEYFVKWKKDKYSHIVREDDKDGLYRRLFKGVLIYPEPWLYLRTGKRYCNWPFKGKFIIVGLWHWQFGIGQQLLRFVVLMCIIAIMICLSVVIRRVTLWFL